MNSSFLLRLNKYVLVPFLVDWLDLKSFGLLDCSFSRDGRNQFSVLLTEFRGQFESKYCALLPELKLSVSVIATAYRKGLPLPNSGIICESFLLELKAAAQSHSIFSWSAPKIELSESVAGHLKNLRTLYLYSCSPTLTGVLSLVLEHCTSVNTEIHLESAQPAEHIFEAIEKNCSNLTKLIGIGNLNKVRLSTWNQLLSKCPQLEEVSLNNTDGTYNGENAETLIESFVMIPSLQRLHVTPTLCSRFRGLMTSPFNPLTNLACDFFNDDTFTYFLESGGGKLLTSLDLSRCVRVHRSAIQIGAHCPVLVELKLFVAAVGLMNADSFTTLIAPLTCLRSFHTVCNYYYYSRVSQDFVVDTLATHCPLLESLSVRKCHWKLVNSFPQLTSLSLEDVSDLGLLSSILQSLGSRLTSLTISNVYEGSTFVSVAPEVCVAVADKCSNLRSLMLSDWCPLPSTAYYLGRLVLLEVVGLHVQENAEVVTLFLKNCPGLTKLRLTCCTTIPVTEWNDLIPLCGNLREFDLKLKPPTPNKEVLMNPNVMRTLLKEGRRLRKVQSRGCHWNVWNIRMFEQELLKIKPDCFISLFAMRGSITIPS